MVGPKFSVTHASIAATSSSASGPSPRTRRTSMPCRMRRIVRHRAGLPDDRGPGGRDLGPVARARRHRRGRGLRGALPLRPLHVARERPGPRLARRVGDAQRARRRHEHAQARHARLTRHVPPPVRARPRGRDRRPCLRRARRARPRRRVARGRAPRRSASRSTASADRFDRLAEQMEIVHRSWTEGPFDFEGRFYRLQGADPLPKPVQDPHPPLIAGGSAKPRGAAPRRPLGGRVQHRLRDGRRVPRAARARGRGLPARRAATRSRSR